MNGRPEGPGMAAEAVVLDLEMAQARPPGWRRKAKMETRRRLRRRASKLWVMEIGKWRRRALRACDDIVVWRQNRGRCERGRDGRESVWETD